MLLTSVSFFGRLLLRYFGRDIIISLNPNVVLSPPVILLVQTISVQWLIVIIVNFSFSFIALPLTVPVTLSCIEGIFQTRFIGKKIMANFCLTFHATNAVFTSKVLLCHHPHAIHFQQGLIHPSLEVFDDLIIILLDISVFFKKSCKNECFPETFFLINVFDIVWK